MSDDLFRAILALDAYNRGYLPRINGLEGIESELGPTTIVMQSDVADGTPGVDASFYAIVYQIGQGDSAERIISFRGPDGLKFWENFNPLGTGSPTDYGQYAIGAGTPINPLTGELFQGAQLPLDFSDTGIAAHSIELEFVSKARVARTANDNMLLGLVA